MSTMNVTETGGLTLTLPPDFKTMNVTETGGLTLKLAPDVNNECHRDGMFNTETCTRC